MKYAESKLFRAKLVQVEAFVKESMLQCRTTSEFIRENCDHEGPWNFLQADIYECGACFRPLMHPAPHNFSSELPPETPRLDKLQEGSK